MGKVRARCFASMACGAACEIAAAVGLFACAGRALQPVRVAENSSIQAAADSAEIETFSESVWGGVSPDSGAVRTPAADGLEEGFSDDVHVESVPSRAGDAVSDTRPARGSYEFTVIAGYRCEARLRVEGWRGFSGGFRTGETYGTGYVRYEGRGLVRALHVGRMTVRAGEELLLGRGLGRYGTSGPGRVRGGFAVSPSLSEWFGITGAALEAGGGAWRLQTVAFVSPDSGARFRPGCVWNSAVKDFASASLGVMAALVDPPSSGAPSGTNTPRLSAVGGHGLFRGVGFDVSAEAARVGSDFYLAGRVAGKDRRTRWSLFVFDAPYEVSPGGPGAEAPVKRDQGVALSVSSRLPGAKGSVRFSSGETVSRSGRVVYRRLIAEVERGGPGPVRWMFRAYVKADHGTDFPTQTVVRDLVTESARELALRAAVRTDSRGAVRTAARIDYLPPVGGLGPGTLVSLSVDLATARIDACLRAASYSLAPGRRAWVSRPGLGPFECFGTLYGHGSDLSLRLRVRLVARSRLLFLYVSSWRGPERAYVGIECRP